jgi:hypothetical protein
MIIARRERQVEWGDCDPARIVFNPRFFEWFDAQTALIFETAGLPKRDLLRRLDFDNGDYAPRQRRIVEIHLRFNGARAAEYRP